MFPSDIKDIITAFVLIVILVAGTSVYKVFYNEDEVLKEIKVNDDKELFLLNFVKTRTDSGELIKDLIVDSENDEAAFEKLREETRKLIEFNDAGAYAVKILYADKEKSIGGLDFEEYYEIKLLDKNKETVIVKMNYNKKILRGELGAAL